MIQKNKKDFVQIKIIIKTVLFGQNKREKNDYGYKLITD